MSGARLRQVLRGAAVAIAILAWIDPALPEARRPLRVAVVHTRDADAALVQATRAALGAEMTLSPAPDPEADAWVVVARSLEHLVPTPPALPISVVLPDRPHAVVRLERVEAPRRVPAGSRAAIAVLLHGRGNAGRESMIRVWRDRLELARATHRWTEDDERAAVVLTPVITGQAPVGLRVSVDGSPDDSGTADVLIAPDDRPISVLTVEGRPSWQATFVRRALQADPALAVRTLTRLARGISAGTAGAGGALSQAALDDIDVVVAGGLEALTGSDVAALDRFVRGGGALLLLPDTTALGAAAALLPAHRLVDRLSETPLAVRLPVVPGVDLWASELGMVDTPLAGATVSAPLGDASAADRQRGSGAVVESPLGSGRVLVVGALDAWRYRDRDDAAFDRAWPALVHALAAARVSGPTLRLTPGAARPGEAIRADLTLQPSWASGAAEIEARTRDGVLRLLPASVAGTLSGTLRAPAQPGVSAVTARVAGCGPAGGSCLATAPLLVGAAARSATVDEDALRAGVEVGGGVVVESGGLDRLRAHLRGHPVRTAAPHAWHPMRSAWWLGPWGICLGAEWLLRRRAGLR